MEMERCQNIAVVRYTWPGENERYACIDHAAQVKGVADAMGFPLQFIPIGAPVSEQLPFVQCSHSDPVKPGG